MYITLILLKSDSSISIYHKTKLVPGVEQIPYSFIFDKITDFTVDLGGVSGSLSIDNDKDMFECNELKILLICYESIFGDIITSKKSNLIAIITNDGWWKNTSGYKHHQYARLRAIEQRKSIIRSINTGISSIISPNGEIKTKTNWDEEIAINNLISVNETITFYNKFGDYIGRIFSFVASFVIINMLL